MTDIKSSDTITVESKATNSKPWFDGVHKFSSVKVNPKPVEETPPPLGINVFDTVETDSKMGH